MTATYSVSTYKLCVSYGPTAVLRDVSISVKTSSIYCLLGASGCGKTSLFKCLLGLQQPTSGQVSVFGKAPGASNAIVPGPGVGYMPQEYTLYDLLTVSEIINYYGAVYGMDKADIAAKGKQLLTLLEMSQFADNYTLTLSGGQKRRVSLAIAVLHSPPLLVLDEPTTGVDMLMRDKIWSFLRQLVDTSGTTIILSSHHVAETVDAGCVALLRNGRLLIEQSPSSLITRLQTKTLDDAVHKLCVENVPLVDVASSVVTSKARQLRKQKSIGAAVRHWMALIWLICTRLLKTEFMRKPEYLMANLMFPLICVFACSQVIGVTRDSFAIGFHSADDLSRAPGAHNYTADVIQLLTEQNLQLVHFRSQKDAIRAVKRNRLPLAVHLHGEFSIQLPYRVQQVFQRQMQPKFDDILYIAVDSANPVQQVLGLKLAKTAIILSQRIVNYQVQNVSELYKKIERNEQATEGNALRDDILCSWLAMVMACTAAMHCIIFTVQDKTLGIRAREFTTGKRFATDVLAALASEIVIASVRTALCITLMCAIMQEPIGAQTLLVHVIGVSASLIGTLIGLFLAVLYAKETVSHLTIIVLLVVGLVVSGGAWPSSLMSDTMQAVAMFAPLVREGRAIKNIMMDAHIEYELLGSAFRSSAVTIAAISVIVYVVVKLRKH